MDFFIDLSRVANRAADLLTQKVRGLFAQAVNGALTDPTNLQNLQLARKKARLYC
jgi:hypothetical protein